MSDDLGIWLRRARETRQLTLEDAEKALRIRRRYLQALEMGDYTAMPGEVQARGFLRNYARFLDLPTEEAVARYDAEIQGRPMQPRPRTPIVEQKSPIADRPSVFSPPPTEEEEATAPSARIPSGLYQMLIIALFFFLLVAGGSFVWLMIESRAPATEATATATAVPPTAVVAAPESQPSEQVFTAAADGTVSVQLVANEHAWISVSADANIIFQGTAAPNQVINARANEMLIVATGNGGAFQMTVNGANWGTLGAQGEAVRRAWNPTGEVPLESQ